MASVTVPSAQAQAQIPSQTYVQVDHILLESKDSADMALNMLGKGVEFDRLAYRWSSDTASARIGGQLPVQLCSDFVPEFASFVCTSPLKTPGVVKTVFGWHVAVVRSRSALRSDVVGPNPNLVAPPFTATATLSCGFPSIPDQNFTLTVDEPNMVAMLGKQPVLVMPSEVEFSLLRSNGDHIVINRTTGLGVIRQPGKPAVSGLVCRSSRQRLF